jgi:hypothetical protein
VRYGEKDSFVNFYELDKYLWPAVLFAGISMSFRLMFSDDVFIVARIITRFGRVGPTVNGWLQECLDP